MPTPEEMFPRTLSAIAAEKAVSERMERLTDIINKLRLRPPPGFEEFSDDLAEALEILQREVI
jgi:hypothetical protein